MSNKNKANKFLINFLAIMLALVLAGTTVLIGVLSNGFKDWSKFTVEQSHTGEASDMGSPVTDENGEELPSDEAVELPKAMTFSSAAMLDGEETPYDSVTVTATVKPENATNKKVDWSVGFVDPDSSWATGKTVTDYVTITPESDGSNKAVIQCLQAFGEQIKVVATSRDNAAAKAECTVDFAQRVEDILICGHYISMDGASVKDPETVVNWFGGYDSTFNDYWFIYKWTDYTKDDYDLSRPGQMYFSIYSGATSKPSDDGIGFIPAGGRGLYMSTQETSVNMYDSYFVGDSHNAPVDKDAVSGWIATHGDEEGYVYLISYTATLVGEYSTFSFEVPIRFTASDFKVAVTGVEISDTEIII